MRKIRIPVWGFIFCDEFFSILEAGDIKEKWLSEQLFCCLLLHHRCPHFEFHQLSRCDHDQQLMLLAARMAFEVMSGNIFQFILCPEKSVLQLPQRQEFE